MKARFHAGDSVSQNHAESNDYPIHASIALSIMYSTSDSHASELQERDEIISLLTKQLEQAAEQLDRMQRAGDAGRASEGSKKTGLSPIIAEGMQKFLTEWEEFQPSLALGRIELALAQLQQTIEQQPFQPATAHVAQPLQQHSHVVKDEVTESDFWSKMKSQIMDENPARQEDVTNINEFKEQSVEHDQAENRSEQVQQNVLDEPFDFRTKRIDEGPDMPPDVDALTAGKEELMNALEARDEYISYLHERLNKAERQEHFKLPSDWSIFNRYPGELRVKLEFLEAQLLSVLRTTEIQQSMERARNARLENKLKFERELLLRHANRLGVSLNDDSKPDEVKKKSLREQENIPKKVKSNNWKLWGNGAK